MASESDDDEGRDEGETVMSLSTDDSDGVDIVATSVHQSSGLTPIAPIVLTEDDDSDVEIIPVAELPTKMMWEGMHFTVKDRVRVNKTGVNILRCLLLY